MSHGLPASAAAGSAWASGPPITENMTSIYTKKRKSKLAILKLTVRVRIPCPTMQTIKHVYVFICLSRMKSKQADVLRQEPMPRKARAAAR